MMLWLLGNLQLHLKSITPTLLEKKNRCKFISPKIASPTIPLLSILLLDSASPMIKRSSYADYTILGKQNPRCSLLETVVKSKHVLLIFLYSLQNSFAVSVISLAPNHKP